MYNIAVPSYKRAHLAQATIKLIQSYNIGCKIHLFLDNKEELKSYNDVVGCEFVVCGVSGIQAKRNFIFEYFKKDELVICFDDSYNGLLIKKKGKLEPFTKIKALIDIALVEMRKKGTVLFGVNIAENPFFMKNKISYKNQLICAKFYGFISQGNKTLNSTNPYGLCEDQETSLRVTALFGGSVRFDGVTFNKPNYGKNEGGLKAVYKKGERKKIEAKACKYLSVKFGDFCEPKGGGVGLRYKKIK